LVSVDRLKGMLLSKRNLEPKSDASRATIGGDDDVIERIQ
jgi:hypothetical protein